MNALSSVKSKAVELVDIIDLKWLMAAEGLYLHVERLQSDTDYARSILGAASSSSTEALRLAARRMWLRLGFAGEPHA
jgi:hypothetical protein